MTNSGGRRYGFRFRASGLCGLWILALSASLASVAAAVQHPSPRGSGTIHTATVMPSRPLEVLRLVRARTFDPVTRAIEDAQAAVEHDIRQERVLAMLVDTFHNGDPTLTPLLDEWMNVTPRSFAPKLARAVHRSALAWERRGSKYADKTTPEQFAGMETFLRLADDDARAVLALNPHVGEARLILMRSAMAFGDLENCTKAADMGIAALPASLRVRAQLALCFLPRWGGSYKLLAELSREADEHLKENPRLAVLHGFIDWDLGNLAPSESDEEMACYDRAIGTAPYASFYRDRAKAHLRRQHYIEALEDATEALQLVPDDPATLVTRASALKRLGRHEEAVAAIRLAEEIEPTSRQLADFRRRELKDGAVEGYRLYEANKLHDAVARFNKAIELAGGNAEIHYWRGRAFLRLEARGDALEDFDTAIRFDPKHFESYRNVDFILAGRGEWDRVIAYWTRYLELEPKDGRAYFERGGAKYHKGDRTSALEDARRACDLGTKDACQFLQRSARE